MTSMVSSSLREGGPLAKDRKAWKTDCPIMGKPGSQFSFLRKKHWSQAMPEFS